jgi:hypothetical protein
LYYAKLAHDHQVEFRDLEPKQMDSAKWRDRGETHRIL